MKNNVRKSGRFFIAAICLLLILAALNSCNKNDDNVVSQSFSVTKLVASKNSYGATRVDTNLVNGWGIAFGPSGTAWISSEGAGVSVVYDQNGAQVLAPVTIPSPSALTGGAPTGQVFNGTTDFVLPGGNPAKFIFAGGDGVISAWNTGTAAVKVADRSATSAYTGITIGTSAANNYLYAADFKGGKIDVFDKNFALVSMPFIDATLPSGYAPFNIQNIGGLLYVVYAKVDPSTGEEAKGPGLGYVDIYNSGGSLVKRYISQGALNAPWGIAAAPTGFLTGHSEANVILVGNFGDGSITAFDAAGNSLGLLSSNGVPIIIEGLWGISFAPASATSVDPKSLFFAAGPNDEGDGLFGYIKP